MKKHIITITGIPGTGKSSTAKLIAESLGYEFFSSGDLFRKMAAERGLSIEEINFTAEKQREIDHEVDGLIAKMGKERDNLVIDSRMAFHLIPGSFRVYLDSDLQTAAERTFKNIQKEGRTSQSGSSIEEVYNNTLKRIESEKKRYRILYDVNIADKAQFNLVVNTENRGLGEVIKIVVDAYQKWINAPA